MIDNEYAYEIDFNFDLIYLENLVLSWAKKNKELKRHQRLVEEDTYLNSIKEKFPLLSSIWNYYDIFPFSVLEPHIDAKRYCALNIPIRGTAGSTTSFYKLKGESKLRYDNDRVLNWVDSDIEKVYEFELTKPTLIKNDIPHSVVNGPTRRIILSWSISIDYTFEEAKKIFKDLPLDNE